MTEQEKQKRRRIRAEFRRKRAELRKKWTDREREIRELEPLYYDDTATPEQERRYLDLDTELYLESYDLETQIEDLRLELWGQFQTERQTADGDIEEIPYWEEFMTPKQFHRLTGHGMKLMSWMAHWMPYTCQELADKGTLYKRICEDAAEMARIEEENYTALGEAGAWELARDAYMNYQMAEI